MIPELSRSDFQRKNSAFLIIALMLSLSFFLPQFASNIGSKAPSLSSKEIGEAEKEKAIKAYGKLPIYFVPNKGQVNSKVKYYAAGAGYSFFLTKEGVTYSFVREKGAKSEAPGSLGKEKVLGPQKEWIKQEGYVLKIQFAGANPAAEIEGQNKKGAKFNYFIGRNKNDWKRNISTFGQATYRNLYPGIDLTYKGKGGRLKYEFAVSPKANYKDIKFVYEGNDSLKLDKQGNLLISAPWGNLKDERPYVYQLIKGKRVPIEASFAIKDDSVGFSLGGHNPNLPLLIDPGLLYSTFLGAGGSDQSRSLALDASGNAYITGSTCSGDFPATAGAYDTSYNGLSEVFIAKLNPSGSALSYSTFLGGTNSDSVSALALDASGNAYITGSTTSSDLPTTAGAFDTSFNGDDVFLTKLDPSGSS